MQILVTENKKLRVSAENIGIKVSGRTPGRPLFTATVLPIL